MESRTMMVIGLGLLILLSTCAPPTDQLSPLSATASPPTAMATPSPPPACPQPQPSLQPTLPPTPLLFPDEYAALIETYLSAGGEAVEALLLQLDALPPRGQAVAKADLTGNGWPESVVAFIDPQSEFFPPAAALAVYTCEAGGEKQLYLHTTEPGLTLALVGAADLTGDGRAELVFFEESCGAHTCWDSPHVWQWREKTFVDLMPSHVEYPGAEMTLEGGGLIITAYGIGSVGGGAQRTLTETWQWQGNAMTITERTESPATHLIHLFQDGDDALRAGEYDTAFTIYRRLLDQGDEFATASLTFSDEEERAWFRALAHWRLLTLDLLLGNYPAANREWTWLVSLPPDDPASPITQVARRFWEAYKLSGNVAYACLEVDNDPQLTPPILNFLNSFGYANHSYSPEEVCPFLDPTQNGGTH